MSPPQPTTTTTKSSSDVAAAAAAPPPLDPVNVESDFVVILAALLCALICVVGLIAIARCAWLRRATGVGSPRQQPSANKGVKKKVLQSLPKFTYAAASSAAATKFAPECAICLGEFVEGDEVRVLPQCGHAFHVTCVDTWLGSHSSCPSCRQILVARCHKCGGIPAAASGSRLTTEVKGGGGGEEDDIEAGGGRCNSDVFLP